MDKSQNHSGQWSSSVGFIIACVGSAVGLGNLWKFPYIAYENGGGAFVLVYLIAILFVGFPILLAEMIIGRHGQLNIYGSFKQLSNNNPFWKKLGALCLVTAFMILSFYSVVAGWTLDYFFNSISGNLLHLTSENAPAHFGSFVGNAPKQIIYHTIFMILTAGIVVKGTKGIEKAVKILMPILFFLIIVIMSVSLYRYGGGESFRFLFTFDFSKLTAAGVLEAVGHAFFTLSLGMGVMIVYGSYLPKSVSIVKAGIWIMIFDTLIALMACFMMYPIIFGTNLDLSESASMLFTTLTVQFNALPAGQYISATFYLLVAFAALSSTISLLEPVVSYISEEFKIQRKKATIVGAFLIWILGCGCALSNGGNEFFTEIALFNKMDYLASNWGLTLGGMFISLFAGFVLTKKVRLGELEVNEKSLLYKGWLFSVRFLAPIMIFIIILTKLGAI